MHFSGSSFGTAPTLSPTLCIVSGTGLIRMRIGFRSRSATAMSVMRRIRSFSRSTPKHLLSMPSTADADSRSTRPAAAALSALFIYTSALILAITAALKVLSLVSPAPVLRFHDSIFFFLQQRHLLLLAVAAEVVVLFFLCNRGLSLSRRVWPLYLLTACFTAYRLAAYVLHSSFSCACAGLLSYYHPRVGTMMLACNAYLLLGSAATLLWATRRDVARAA